MTTTAQIEANRRNAQASTGPTSARGKAIARQNALKDGLTGEGVVLTARDQKRVDELMPAYLKKFRPQHEHEIWQVRRLVIEQVRADRCFAEENAVRVEESTRAMCSWVEDREAEIARYAAQLEKRPEVVSRELNRSLWGALWLDSRWRMLLGILEAGSDWSEADCSLALDLLGVAHVLRKPGTTPIDVPADQDSIEYRAMIARDQIEALESRIEGPLAMLDQRHQARVIEEMIVSDNPRLNRLRRCEAASLRRLWKLLRSLNERDGNEGSDLQVPQPIPDVFRDSSRPAPPPAPRRTAGDTLPAQPTEPAPTSASTPIPPRSAPAAVAGDGREVFPAGEKPHLEPIAARTDEIGQVLARNAGRRELAAAQESTGRRGVRSSHDGPELRRDPCIERSDISSRFVTQT
ncbi:MAG: hypothetical protein SFX72_07675 [Isosphaeraceae bacterium]|nr:hypothetical protein [Isosphaeraceae bacterium]